MNSTYLHIVDHCLSNYLQKFPKIVLSATHFWILLDLYQSSCPVILTTGFLVSTSQSAPFKRPKLRWDPHVVSACSYALGEGWHLNPNQTVFHGSSMYNRFLPLAWNKRRNTDIHSSWIQKCLPKGVCSPMSFWIMFSPMARRRAVAPSWMLISCTKPELGFLFVQMSLFASLSRLMERPANRPRKKQKSANLRSCHKSSFRHCTVVAKWYLRSERVCFDLLRHVLSDYPYGALTLFQAACIYFLFFSYSTTEINLNITKSWMQLHPAW